MNLKNIFLAACLLLVGCASVSDEQVKAEAAKVGYGTPPQEGWENVIKEYLGQRLKDPMSAVYQFGQPVPGMVSKAPIRGGGLDAAGYLVTVAVNAKNSYGGYTGFMNYHFLLRDGQIIRAAEGNSSGVLFWHK